MANRFLELVPLVFFTGMAIIAAGLMIGMSWLLLADIYLFNMSRYFLLITALAGVGVLISLFHLGQKRKLYRAILGLGHSWLSREVIFAGFFIVFTLGIFILVNTGQAANLINLAAISAVISGVIMTWTIGMVYNLSGRFTWKGLPYSAAPFVTALFLGTYVIIFFNPRPGTNLEFLFFTLWLLDFIMGLARSITFRRLKENKYRFVFPHLIYLTGTGHMIRLVLSFSLLMTVFFLFKRMVLFLIIAGIILDRLCFYAGTVGVSPKAEIAFQKAERMKQAVS